MKVKRILLVCVFALILMLSLAACDDIIPDDNTLDDNTPPAHEHTIAVDDLVPATCKNSGLTSGAHCSECGEILVEQEKIDKLDHTLVVDEAVESTCDKTGLTSGAHCSECGEILIAQSEVSLKAHTYDDKYDAFCNVCGYERDAECAHVELETIPGKPATCTEDGITDGNRCANCGEVFVAQTIIDKLGHTETVDAAVAATCTTTGLTEGKHCSRCSEVLVPQNIADKLGHAEVIDEAVSATCTVTGLTEGKHCLRCNRILVAQQTIPANGHTYEFELIPPTTTEDGYITYTCQCGDSYTEIIVPIAFTVTDSNRELIGYTGQVAENLVIPTVFENNGIWYRVTSIGDDAFSGCSSLTSIVIPDSVTSIGDYAFDGCSSLAYNEYDNAYYLGNDSNPYLALIKAKNTYISSCTINSNTRLIYADAFRNCSSLTSIVIPDSVTSIGDRAFRACSSLTSVVIPDSVTSIGEYAFLNSSSLTSIVIPDSVTSIGESAFNRCSSLESITVENGNTVYHSAGNCLIETASKTLIAGCKNSVIPTDGSVTSIGESAFSGCSSLTSVVIPDSVTSIGDEAFYGCSSLTSIVIPDSVTSIGGSAFAVCYNLTSVVIPDSVTSIGEGAFSHCFILTSIVIPDSVTSIGDRAFDSCYSLTSITFTGTVQQWIDIIKDYDWDYNVPATVVVCSDGTVRL